MENYKRNEEINLNKFGINQCSDWKTKNNIISISYHVFVEQINRLSTSNSRASTAPFVASLILYLYLENDGSIKYDRDNFRFFFFYFYPKFYRYGV